MAIGKSLRGPFFWGGSHMIYEDTLDKVQKQK
jgi:hypothetical protein